MEDKKVLGMTLKKNNNVIDGKGEVVGTWHLDEKDNHTVVLLYPVRVNLEGYISKNKSWKK